MNIISLMGTGFKTVLIIYTGGTLGMVKNELGHLVPDRFSLILEKIPKINELDLQIAVTSFQYPLDSSDIGTSEWQRLAKIITQFYDKYDGFVVLHGTDTMAYTASMLTFMLKGLAKPVIFTGAQRPISLIRSDATENLITAIQIAGAYKNSNPIIQEVCIFFNQYLIRGCRAQKVSNTNFDAFKSKNFPFLAISGVEINYNIETLLKKNDNSPIDWYKNIDTSIYTLKIFPGLNKKIIEAVLSSKIIKGIILESFGSGTIMNQPWIYNFLKDQIQSGKIILNVSQCVGGNVNQKKYHNSSQLEDIGVISGKDITMEAALTKMMIILGNFSNIGEMKKQLTIPWSGEFTP